jgi:hypothetical protein
MTNRQRQDGFALLVGMMAVLLLTALGTALSVSSSSETMIAAQFRNGIESRYAAGMMIERGIAEVMPVADWSMLIAGSQRSSWVDGPSTGSRTLSDGSRIDLAQVTNRANCEKTTACSQADLTATSPDRPWGANNPRWVTYAHGPLQNMLPDGVASPFYVVLLVANGLSPDHLAMRAEAFGPRGAHAVTEVTLGSRTVEQEEDYNDGSQQRVVKVLSWREVR